MKNKLLVAVTLLLAWQAGAEQIKATPLLPEVKKLLEMPAIDQSKMDQNAFVYFYSLTAQRDDYQEEGKRMVLYTQALIQEAVHKHKVALLFEVPDEQTYRFKQATPTLQNKVRGTQYQYPCYSLVNFKCLTQVLEQQATTNALLKTNALFIKRYKQLSQLPHYDAYYLTTSTTLPAYQHLIILSGFRQIEAVEAINKGEIDRGLTILNEEISFSKRMLAGDGYLIDAMIAVRLLLTQYHTLSELIDSPVMAKELNNPQFTALFKPLTAVEQQAMSHVYQKELAMILAYYQAIDQGVIDQKLQERMLGRQISPDYRLTYDRNKTLNSYYEFFAAYIKQAQVTLPEAAHQYPQLQLKTVLARAKPLSSAQIYQRYGADNFFGGLSIEQVKAIHYEAFLYRFYDLVNYLALINAKLAIKQAHITPQEVPALLQKLGDKAQNPYSKNPFLWDKSTQTLSSDWLDITSDTASHGVRATVKIVF